MSHKVIMKKTANFNKDPKLQLKRFKFTVKKQ